MGVWQTVKDTVRAWHEGHGHHHGPDDIKVPETLTPVGIHVLNGLAIIGIWLFLSLITFPVFKGESLIFMFFATIVITGFMIAGGVITVSISDWYATLVFDPFTKRRRVMFQGFHWKLIWERPEWPLKSLKRHTAPRVDANFSTNDPAEKMDVKILIHVRPDTRPKSAEEDADMFIRYQSIDETERDEIIAARIRNMFGAHYGTSEMEALGNLHVVQKAVIEDNHANHAAVHKMEKDFGVHIGVELEQSLPDEATKEMKRLPARAEGFRTAMLTLKKPDEDGEPLLDSEKARRAALALDHTAEFQETFSDFGLRIDAHGLENLQSVSVVTPGIPTDKTKSGKGGGKK